MKLVQKIQVVSSYLTQAIKRFPLTATFFAGTTVVNSVIISRGGEYKSLIFTLLVGAFLSAVLQLVYERFSANTSHRLLLMGIAALLTIGYYFINSSAPKFSFITELRTSIALFTLFISFIWVPVIKSSLNFNQSFMVTFKAYITTLLFSGTIFLGLAIITTTINALLVAIHYTAYAHMANIIFILFAPLYFLSQIPSYPGKADESREKETIKHKKEEIIKRKAACPRVLETLISYIIIPLLVIFTIVIVAYIALNIGGNFWKDNLLEPMLISYSIAVLLVYILASELENNFARYFRIVFPELLVPIVLLQIAASIIKISEVGLTHTRYFAILYGIYAAISGIILSIVPPRKNGIIAAMLIIFTIVSIVPPFDAFTLSRTNQTRLLKKVLMQNNMLKNNRIIPKSTISTRDKERIRETVSYLDMMEYTEDIKWLPVKFALYKDFERTFGFKRDESSLRADYVSLSLKKQTAIDISGSDRFVEANILIRKNQKNEELKLCDFKKSGRNYTLIKKESSNECTIELMEKENVLLSIKTKEIFDKFSNHQVASDSLSAEEATFSKANELAKLTLVFDNIEFNKDKEQPYYEGDVYIFVRIEEP